MAPSTDRQMFREALAQIAATAKEKLPECNGRVESAAALVLAGDVTLIDAHTAQVGSQTDPAKVYAVAPGLCSCADFPRAPQGLCKHRLSVAMARRVLELVPPAPEPEPAPAPLPEAPASCNVYVTISGHKVQVTLRDTDERRMLTRLQVLLDQYPATPAPPQAESHTGTPALSPQQHNALAQHQATGVCKVHGVAMKLNTKDGRQWWSHKTAEGWCKGKGGARG
jgi:hypothetical protein